MDFLKRYNAGECKAVWDDLIALQGRVREPPFLSDATAVAQETMVRVRRNVERLIASLRDIGYQFRSEEWAPNPIAPASPDIADTFAELESRISGSIPLSLKAFYETMGGISLRGEHPSWSLRYPDELIVEPLADLVEGDCLMSPEDYGEDYWVLEFSPDFYHKADVSGGAPYSFALPDAGADAMVLYDRHKLRFVDYLRLCFRWGGFPGQDLGDYRESTSEPCGVMPAEHLNHLRRHLEEF